MWYDTQEGEWLETEEQLREILETIAVNNDYYFREDEFMDECYPPVEYFSAVFYPSKIIKNLDPNLYYQIKNEIMSDWVEENIQRLSRYDIDYEDSIEDFLETGIIDLEEIVWKERD